MCPAAAAFENEKQKENKFMGMFFMGSHIFRKPVSNKFWGLVVDASLTSSSTSSLLHSPNFQFGEILDLKESNYF